MKKADSTQDTTPIQNPSITQSHFNMWNCRPQRKSELKMWYNEVLRQHALAALCPRNAMNILDMGCGQGYTTCRMVKPGRNISALDIDSKILSTWSEQAAKNNINIYCTSLFDFNEKGFDFLISQEVIEHIPDYQGAIKKGCELIRKGGKILICVPYKENLAAKSIYDPQSQSYINKNGHLHSFTIESILNPLIEAGTRRLSISYHSNKRLVRWLVFLNLPYHPLLLTIDRVMNAIFTNKAAYVAILAEKL